MKFYNVKKRQSVFVPDAKCTKVSYESNGRTVYAMKAVDDDGTHLTIFVNKAAWDKSKCKKG